jgi:hypothetical protein
LGPRDPATDPLWPARTPADFYVGNPIYSGSGYNIEYLSELENIIIEQIPVPSPTNPDSTVERVTLDSLYHVYGPSYPGQLMQPGSGVNVVMTVYHGRENPLAVFSGVDIWTFKRSDCQALVDFVLGQLWHLPKNAAPAPRAIATRSFRQPAALPARSRPPQPGPARRPAENSTFQRWR